MKIKELISTVTVFAVLLPLVVIFPSSCASSALPAQAEKYQIVNFDRVIPLFPADAGQKPRTVIRTDHRTDHRLTLSFALLEARGSPGEIEFINDTLYSGSSPSRYRDMVIQDWQARYLESREIAASQAIVSDIFNWDYRESMEYVLLKERGIQIKRETYMYSGGAHGMLNTQYYVCDRTEQKVLKLDDFFRDETWERLHGVVADELRRYHNSLDGEILTEGQPLSQGIFFTDHPGLTDNFFINSQGLGLSWDPYEIAPYSAGNITILIPWKAIRPLLRHDAMELLEKFGIPMFM